MWKRSENNPLGLYIEVDGVPIPEPDSIKWAMWYETADTRVELTDVGDMQVSTIFLAIDHNLIGVGPPKLYETMVFKKEVVEDEIEGRTFKYHPSVGEQWRYPTREMARLGHFEMVEKIKKEELQ